MLNYNELRPGKYIVVDGQPCIVVEFSFLRMQQRKPVAQTKIKSLVSGKTIERTFQQSDKLEEADINTKKVKYLYNNKGEYWFCDEKNPGDRFKLDSNLISDSIKFIKENSVIDSLVFNDEIIGVNIPVKVDLLVKQAPDAVKGNTAQGATKQVVLETGAIVNTPLFINEGDIIKVNTETGQYTERVEKK